MATAVPGLALMLALTSCGGTHTASAASFCSAWRHTQAHPSTFGHYLANTCHIHTG